MRIKPFCGECLWVYPFHAPWCSKDCLPALLFVCSTVCAGCILDVTPDPYVPPPLTWDAGDEDSGQ